jgi:hypothetical protein
MAGEPIWRPTRKWRRHVYYKVQLFDSVALTWRDEKPAFDDLKDARRYIAERVPHGATARVMAVDGRARTPVDPATS